VAQVKQYEDELTQSIGYSLIPEKVANAAKGEAQLKALLKWFKEEFFTWTDKPKCRNCDRDDHVQPTGGVRPTEYELKEGGASRVEGYKCFGCGQQIRFPRYNNPRVLLETRTGRCGEWANCFTCLVRTLGYEARLVLDFTDHVWTEALVDGKWVHMDPCENAYDTPLVYERGWGKKLTYCFAYGPFEIVDVTKRYVLNHAVNRMRRIEVNEEWLKKDLHATRI